MREICSGELVCGRSVRRKRLERGVGLKGNAKAGQAVEPFEEGGVERQTEVGEGVDLNWVVGVVGGEHAGGGCGGFGQRGTLVEDGDAMTAVMQFESE